MLELYTTQSKNSMNKSKTYDPYRYVSPPLKTKKSLPSRKDSSPGHGSIYHKGKQVDLVTHIYVNGTSSPVNIIEVP